MVNAFLQGFGIGASLIVAIGPQNAFVISQGLRREHVFLVACMCLFTDTILISLGTFGLGAVFQTHPLLIEVARWFGAIFLTAYGLRSFIAALHPGVLKAEALSGPAYSTKRIVFILLGLGFLNPHAYLDTVVLLGSISAQYAGFGRYAFGLGAIGASIVWFFSIAYGARVLTPLFKKPLSWRVLDIIIGCVMWVIAVILIWPVVSPLL